MPLSPEQKQAVAAWVAAGDSLAVIQKKLSEQFKLSLTYMDVRFLVDDLGLELKKRRAHGGSDAELPRRARPSRPRRKRRAACWTSSRRPSARVRSGGWNPPILTPAEDDEAGSRRRNGDDLAGVRPRAPAA